MNNYKRPVASRLTRRQRFPNHGTAGRLPCSSGLHLSESMDVGRQEMDLTNAIETAVWLGADRLPKVTPSRCSVRLF